MPGPRQGCRDLYQQEGTELSTSGNGFAEVKFENGSTARLRANSTLLFHQLTLDADGSKQNGMTLERGNAVFHILPEGDDAYAVKVAELTLTPLRIPLKVGGDSDLNPVTGSGAKPGVFGAQRRWRSYGA